MKKILNLSTFIAISSWPMLSLCSCSANGFVIANYESYMSPLLIERLHHIPKTPVQFDYYQTNEQIMEKFTKSYDISFPSTYTIYEMISKHVLTKYNWTQFNLKANIELDPSQSNIAYAKPVSSYPGGTFADKLTALQNDKANAMNLFSLPIILDIAAIDYFGHTNSIYTNDDTMLNYGIPYFSQDWLFGYTGDVNTNLNPTSGSPTTWNQAMSYIMPNGDAQLPRFKKYGNHPQLAMINDGRTVYDFANIVRCEQNATNPISVNPQSLPCSKQDIANSYQSLTRYCKKNNFFLNTDSQQVLYALGTGAVKGAFAYTGDILYALEGGGDPAYENTWNNTNFHVVKPQNTLHCMEMVVLNKKDQYKQKAYDIIKDITLDGSDVNADKDHIGIRNEKGDYVYDTMLNFDFVSYTPTLYSVYQYCIKNGDNYFTDPDGLNWDSQKASLGQSIINNNDSSQQTNNGELFEHPLDDKTKLNMQMEWFKSCEDF